MNDIKAIIFDCFGVLVESTLEPFCKKYFGDDSEKIAQVKILDNKASSGLMSYGEFVAELAILARIPTAEAQHYLDNTPANAELLDYIQNELRPKYKIGFLSNAYDNWLDELFTPAQTVLFDDIVLSYEHRLAKPDKAIYLLAAKRLGVKPSECVFVDDILEYCESAKSAEMQAIQYQSFTQFHRDLAHTLSSKK